MPESMVWITGVIMLVLLICSALISASEVAFFSLEPKDLEEIENNKSKKAKNVLGLIERPKKLLATILITNNLVNVGIIILSTVLVESMFQGVGLSAIAQFWIQVIGVTFIILLFGEVIPKVYATRNNVSLALFMSFPLIFLRTFFGVPSRMLIRSTNFIERRIKPSSANLSVDKLEQALVLTQNDSDNDSEQKILEGIVRFGNTDVKQIMTPRMDVTALTLETGFEEVIAEIIDAGFSRIPVYENSFDEIKGILYAKDLIPHLEEGDDFKWQELIRPPFFVPESKKIDDLLKEFQERKIHLAIVVDEYGGSMGIVSLEDVLEEIVGDITDEFDEEDLVYSRLDEHNYVFEGKTPLIDLYKVLDIDGEEFEEEKGDADTLAGFMVEIAGKILRKNEKVSFDRYLFTVESADKRRVKRVKITLQEPLEAKAEKEEE